MKTITQLDARKLIKESKGRMLTVKFIKGDGSFRKLNGRLGVSKGVQGTGRANDDPNLIRIAEMRRNALGHILPHEASKETSTRKTAGTQHTRARGEIIRGSSGRLSGRHISANQQ